MKPSLKKEKREDQPRGNSYLLQSAPGLANVLNKEMVFAGLVEKKQQLFIKRQRNHDLIFVNRFKSEDGIRRVRMAEAIYQCPIFGRFKISKSQLEVLADALKKVGPRRLVVSVAGKVFDRRDLSRWLEKELSARGYDFDKEIEDEVWMFCIDENYYFGIPLTKARYTEGRDERTDERGGSLPPPVAAALAFAGMPKPDDVILDPVCGSGTLLAEAAAYSADAKLIGFDIDPQAVKIAKANLGEKAQIFNADSRKPHDARKDVSLVLANLPFGVQFGDKASNPKLYADIIEECLRTANPARFRAVLFTSDIESLRTALEKFKTQLDTQDLFKVKVRGETAFAILAKRKVQK